MAQTDQTPEPRTPLSRERVLGAAIAMADEGGIEALTMRKLAHELGVEAMSLYHYVAKKDDLLAGIVDIVLLEIELPAEDADWKAGIRQIAISAHDALTRHPWACRLVLGMKGVSPARFRYMEALLATLREAGFAPELTYHAYHALDSHIMGFTLWVGSFSVDTSKDLASLASSFLKDFPAEQYPYLAEHIEQHITESGHDGVSDFEFVLDLILDGLERMQAAA
jgi:AcrR family transcriptional regulator